MKYVLQFFAIIAISYGSITLHDSFKQEPLPQMIKSPSLNKPFYFAGEEIPRANQEILDRLDRELVLNTYLHSSTMLNLKLAARHFPKIEKILKEEGIPDDFKYLVPVESNFSNAVSPAGARGFWQFMSATANDYKLEVNSKVDERYHIEKSTYAAAKFLKDLHRQFDNWTLVAAAYNGGGGRIARELEAQKVTNFYDLYLNAETTRYIFRILAIKEIMSNPELFGFDLANDDLYAPYTNMKEVQVTSTIPDLVAYAQAQGTTYRLLRYYNPWIIDRDLPVKPGKTYTLFLPTHK